MGLNSSTDTRIKVLENENKKLAKIIEDYASVSLDKSLSDKINNESTKVKIENMVDEMLKDETINIGYLPDYIEKKIYTNVFTLAVNIFKKLSSEASISVLNHDLEFKLR